MSPREHNRADATEHRGDLLRRAVYAAVAVAVIITLWALTKGNDRDLWSEASAAMVAVGRAAAT